MGNILPLNPAGGPGSSVPQIPTPQVVPPQVAPPIQIPLGKPVVPAPGIVPPQVIVPPNGVQVPIVPTPNTNPPSVTAPTVKDVGLQVAALKQKLGEWALNSTDKARVEEFNYLVTHLNFSNVDIIEALLNRGADFYKNFIYDHGRNGLIKGVLESNRKEMNEIFALIISNGRDTIENSCRDYQSYSNVMIQVAQEFRSTFSELTKEEINVFKDLLKSIMEGNNKLGDKKLSPQGMYNLFRDIAFASKNRLGVKNVNTENTLFSDLKLAAKLCQSEKLLAKPDGLNKIPMLIANRNAYQSVIADLLKP